MVNVTTGTTIPTDFTTTIIAATTAFTTTDFSAITSTNTQLLLLLTLLPLRSTTVAVEVCSATGVALGDARLRKEELLTYTANSCRLNDLI